ncbi:MAG: SatD family protein [Acidimicrobiia bacterium]
MTHSVALIGDVVGSRQAPDRAALQRLLVETLSEVTTRLGSQLTMTVGDEFQGRYPDLETAMAASMRLHLGLIGAARLRLGIGHGPLSFETASGSPLGQDGPVWWRARDAIESIEAGGDQARTKVHTDTVWDGVINAYLLLRDTLVRRLDETDGIIGVGLLDGVTQKELANRLGLNQSSVSRRVNGHGLAALVAAAGFSLGDLEANQ